MVQIELTESDNELPRKLAAILRKGTRHPDYFTPDGLQSEVWPVSRRLFDILEAAITERIPVTKLDRAKPSESPVKKGRETLDSLGTTLIDIDGWPTLHLRVRIGIDDKEEELSHRLTWGVWAWGGNERIKKIDGMVEELDLKTDKEKALVFKGFAFGGGVNFYLGNDLSPDELENQPLAQLVDQIVNDFEGLFGRFKPRKEEIMIELGSPPKPDGPGEPSLSRYFATYGLHFTPYQLATFYTALKTKGFVILTGISGTGKTKLGQYFAELLSSKDQFHFAAVRPDWRDSKSLLGYFNPLLGEQGQFQSTDFLQFLLQVYDNYRSSLHKLKWEADGPYASTLLAEEPNAFSTDTVRLGLKAVNAGGQVVAEGTFEFTVNEGRQLALPERISKLQPFRSAAEIYALELDRVSPYFVLLDEMNLAKVEYYFADLLSVLESGRQPDGFTKEAIALHPFGNDIEDADGVSIPSHVKLPPNLYFVGTVNVDETTYMFSPKVLDRAFTLELSEVDFTAYPSERDDSLSQEELEELRAQLLPDFTNQGRFAIVDKAAVADFVQQYPTCREHLTKLNTRLQPYDLHFGYRVFDEIMMFLANAEGSPVFDGFGPDGLAAAFDAAVLMKVLPKFHGTRGKLRLPLLNVFAWAMTPDVGHELRRQVGELEKEISGSEEEEEARLDLTEKLRESPGEARIKGETFTYPRTALKALRMLHDLYTTGFASFA